MFNKQNYKLLKFLRQREEPSPFMTKINKSIHPFCQVIGFFPNVWISPLNIISAFQIKTTDIHIYIQTNENFSPFEINFKHREKKDFDAQMCTMSDKW